MILKPRLASQAANVNKIILVWGSIIIDEQDINGTNKTVHNIILSKQNKDIRRCENWRISAIVVTKNARRVKNIIDSE